jgi:rhamnosyltransferase subunit B
MRGLSESKRIVIATIGSLGDLHPCLCLSLELMRRGHHVTIAATPHYKSKVEALGITFRGQMVKEDGLASARGAIEAIF